MNFADRLKKFRNEDGITQKELASKIGVSRTTVAGYETEGKMPPYNTLIKIAQTLNCSIDYLLGYDQKENYMVKESKTSLNSPYEMLSQREDLQLLIRKTKDLHPDSIKRIVKIIDLIKEEKDAEIN